MQKLSTFFSGGNMEVENHMRVGCISGGTMRKNSEVISD